MPAPPILEACMVDRRAAVNFAFGNFDIQRGFAVSHQYDRMPAIIRPGDPITLRATTVAEYRHLTVYVLDGSGPYQPEDIKKNGDAIAFVRSGNDWLATLPAGRDGLIQHYIVEAEHRTGGNHYADGRHSIATAKVFAHRITTRVPPAWTKNAVMYQIFVDRFANGDGPVSTPYEAYEDFAGGDLHGVRANLRWIADLGVTCIWLTPTFTCHSYHGYDTVDFKHIDPRFGGDEALRSLIDDAHDLGIRILLDLVPNHISDKHPWFQSALAGGPERDWFTFASDGSYLTFFNTQSMPKVNLDHPDAREAMLDIATYWIDEFGVDGYRIDHALGPTESFFAALAERVEQADPDAWMFGEVTATPQLCRRYGGILDGVTDFIFCYAMREVLAGTLDPSVLGTIEREAAAVLQPDEFSWVRFFDNHDMSRAIQRWNGDERLLAVAVRALCSLPGVPAIFYGTEQGLTHTKSEEEAGLSVGRVPMAFDADHDLASVIRIAIGNRGSTDQSDPVYWEPDGTAWEWGDLRGSIPDRTIP